MHGQTDAWRVPGYTEIRELGRGGAGRVVLARHDADDILVAIKYLSDELMSDLHFVARFRHEANLLASMEPSPHAAKFYEYVEVPRGAAIVMELINGVSLRAMLRSEGPTGPEAALAVLKGSLLGLAVAHGAGVVHRDYKPENVMVEADGTSKLVDFGVAAHIGQGAAASGTPPYMAPEQWSGGVTSPATDVYAATVVFFECLTGSRPFRAQSMAALARQHQVTPPPVEEVPPSLRGLVERGMAKRAADRPQSALEFLQELEVVAADVYGPAWEERGRRRLAALAGLLVHFFPLAEEEPEVGTSVAETHLGRGLLGKMSVKIGLTVVVMAAITGGTAAVVGSLAGTTLQAGETIVSPTSSPADPLTLTPATDEPADEDEDDLADDEATETPSAADPEPTASNGPKVRPRPTATGGPARQPTSRPTTGPTSRPTPRATPSTTPRAKPTPKPSPRPSPKSTTRRPSPSPATPEPTATITLPRDPQRTTSPPSSRPAPTQTTSSPEPTGDGAPPPRLTSTPVAPDASAVPMGVFALGLMTTGLVPATLAVKRAAGKRRRRDSR